MSKGVYVRTPEHCAKISAALRGKKKSPEHCAKISVARRNNKASPEARANMSAARKGKPNPHEGRPCTTETRAKMRAANTGRKRTLEACEKISKGRKGKCVGSAHPRWLGGISREPYDWEWNAELREEVRRRDGYKCQKCGVPQDECRRALNVHHVDYDKKNSDPVNLTALCGACNAKVNANRAHWTAVFQAKAIERSIEEIKNRA